MDIFIIQRKKSEKWAGDMSNEASKFRWKFSQKSQLRPFSFPQEKCIYGTELGA